MNYVLISCVSCAGVLSDLLNYVLAGEHTAKRENTPDPDVPTRKSVVVSYVYMW